GFGDLGEQLDGTIPLALVESPHGALVARVATGAELLARRKTALLGRAGAFLRHASPLLGASALPIRVANLRPRRIRCESENRQYQLGLVGRPPPAMARPLARPFRTLSSAPPIRPAG